ncbi:MAG: Na(+)/H(+) antiporter subunit B [Gammaproteobacteria bacterium]|jgi:multisubunit Na+/H+ antiporter MnhB subunit
MEALVWTFLDIVLLSALLALGWGALASKDVRRAVVLFIGFGLLLALIWVRLRAPDVALAEAAIGAGLTGALLLSALRDESGAAPAPAEEGASASNPARPSRLLTVLSAGLTIVLGSAFVYALDHADPARLAHKVFAHLEVSGVSNPVTGVLLNFRAYDTLLELAVLLAAVLGILALGPARPGYAASGLVLSGLTRWLVPLLILVGGYVLWMGAHAPGGAFQAGALLAAAGVLLRIAGHHTGLPQGMALRVLVVVGVAVFLTVGLAVMLAGRPFLGYPVAWAGSLILVIETAATLGIAVTLLLAFVCGEPEQWIKDREIHHSADRSHQVKSTPGKSADVN